MKPACKLLYNTAITAISACVALVVGGVELLGLIGSEFDIRGAFWQAAAWLNGHSVELGFGIIAVFTACWIAAAALYRLGKFALEPRALD